MDTSLLVLASIVSIEQELDEVEVLLDRADLAAIVYGCRGMKCRNDPKRCLLYTSDAADE